MPFRAKPFARHKLKWAPVLQARNCDFRGSGIPADICAAEDEKTDIDWF
jgi:hypothetical protein